MDARSDLADLVADTGEGVAQSFDRIDQQFTGELHRSEPGLAERIVELVRLRQRVELCHGRDFAHAHLHHGVAGDAEIAIG
jgi:hypothetical protein